MIMDNGCDSVTDMIDCKHHSLLGRRLSVPDHNDDPDEQHVFGPMWTLWEYSCISRLESWYRDMRSLGHSH